MASAWKLYKGSMCEYKWNKAGTIWYKGTVLKRRGNNLVIKFDDNEEHTLPLKPGWYRQVEKPVVDNLDSAGDESDDDKPSKIGHAVVRPKRQAKK